MNSNDYHQSVRKPKSSILIIWIIPFIALIIAASLIAKHFLDKGEEITIVFKGAEGFTIGKTPLNYKGIKVGIVSNIKINEKNSREFLVTVTVDNSAVSLIEKKGTKFWKVEPKISLSEVSGLSTIISGSYIEMLPGKGTFRELNRRDYFIAERSKPIASYQDGFFINLQSDRGDLSDGAPLLYEKYAIGKVVKKELKKEKFLYTIFVNEKYGDLIKEDSHFWNVSSVEFEAALSGIKFNIASFSSLISGGVMFDSPINSKVLKDTSHVFDLCQSKNDLHTPGETFTLRVRDLGSLSAGDGIYYKRMNVGEVSSFIYNKKTDLIDVKIFIKEKFRSLINSSTRFYRQSGVRFELDRDHMRLTTGAMDTVLQGGLAFVVNDKKAAKVAKNYTFKLYENELLANAENTFVSVMMDRGFKLKSGSQVLYKDLKVGYVESLHFYGDHKVKARVAIDKKHASLLVKDTLFWVEDLEATVRGIKNAPAAIFGPSLVLQPGKSSVSGKNYILSEKKPFRIYTREGLRIMVKGNRKSSIKPGAPLLYRQLKVGFVEHYDLAKDGTTVNVGLFIEKKYAHMVRKNTRFYLLSAIGMKIGLTGIKVMTETLDSMIYGGIGMATSEEGLGAKAQEGDSFLLELEADDDWYEWAPKLSS